MLVFVCLCFASLVSGSIARSFTVAEVKPHYACTSANGTSAVRRHISNLSQQRYGIIALIQVQFKVEKPEGYIPFGDACCSGRHCDNVVVLLDETLFSLVDVLGTTTARDYASMPFVHDGQRPVAGSGCVVDPATPAGVRAYAGAVLRHRDGQEFCIVSGTLPHHDSPPLAGPDPLGKDFLAAIESACARRPLLFVLDTNVYADNKTVEDVGRGNGADWGTCSDPGVFGPKTCCNDLQKGYPYATLRFDRTVMCRGGSVTDWQVKRDFVCGTNEEHLFTSARVELPPQSKTSDVLVYA